jgi:hypothetical protein
LFSVGSIKQHEYNQIRKISTIRSGTMMEHSNLPIRKWYLAMAFMSFSKKGISATELQRQLNHKRYEPIWRMMHKIRAAMGQRDSKYQLEGMIEFDEGYFATEINTKKKKKLKRGRGSQKNEIVSVMAESTPLTFIRNWWDFVLGRFSQFRKEIDFQ